MIDAQTLLHRRYQEIYNKLYGQKSDLLEQNKVRSSLNQMEGGFGTDTAKRIDYEAKQYEKGLREQEKTQSEILAEQKKALDEEKRKAKIGNILKTAGTVGGAIVGGVLTAPVGGMGAAMGASIGAGLGGNIGRAGNTLWGTGEAPDFDFGFLESWDRYKEYQKNL